MKKKKKNVIDPFYGFPQQHDTNMNKKIIKKRKHMTSWLDVQSA